MLNSTENARDMIMPCKTRFTLYFFLYRRKMNRLNAIDRITNRDMIKTTCSHRRPRIASSFDTLMWCSSRNSSICSPVRSSQAVPLI